MAQLGVTIQHPNFRDAPNLDSNVIRVLGPGTALQVLGQENDYWRVDIGGQQGYVHVSLVALQPQPGEAPEAQPAGELASAAGVDAWFRAHTGLDFISWFNTNHAGEGQWAAFAIQDGPLARDGFAKVWDHVEVVFGRPGVSLEQFLCLTGIILNETGGRFQPISELVGTAGHPGIAYAFDEIPGLKVSYNAYSRDLNLPAGELFRDLNFAAAFADRPLASLVMNTRDPRWDGKAYPVGDFPTSTDPAVSGIILEADFYKFRGRGFIQTTWRAGYKRLIEFVQSCSDPNPVLQRYKAAWAGKDPDLVATTSSNADWDDLFQNTDCIVACAGIGIHNRDHGGYLSISPDRGVLAGDGPGSAYNCGLRVSGGHDYASRFRARVLQLRDSLPA